MKHTSAILLLSLLLVSCYNDKYEELHPLDNYINDCDTSLADTYIASVSIVINNNCASCHNQSNKSGNIDLSSYDAVVSSVKGGRFMGSVQQSSGYSPMPPNIKLQACEIDRLQRWIQKSFPK